MNNIISIGDLITFSVLGHCNTIIGIVLKVDWAWSDLFSYESSNTTIKVALLKVYSKGKIGSITSLNVIIVNSVL